MVSHPLNCGVGAAWQTGFAWAKREEADLVVTMDGDGQHEALDLQVLLDASLHGKWDIVNGSRFKKRKIENVKRKNEIPFFRRFGNFWGNVLTWMLSGIWVTDSQSGMKAFQRRALERLNLQSNGYEVCSEVFREAAWFGLIVYEVPISVRYTDYSLSKGQGFSAAFSMVARLVVRSLMR